MKCDCWKPTTMFAWELEEAIKNGVFIIPIYVNGATPEDLKSLPAKLLIKPVFSAINASTSALVFSHEGSSDFEKAYERLEAELRKRVTPLVIPDRTEVAHFRFRQHNSDGAIVYEVDAETYIGHAIISPPVQNHGALHIGYAPNRGLNSPLLSMAFYLEQFVQDWPFSTFSAPPPKFSIMY